MFLSLCDRKRFDLRETAIALVDPLLTYVFQQLEAVDFQIAEDFQVKANFDGEIFSLSSSNDFDVEISILPTDFLERINELGGIDVDFEVSSSLEASIDGSYCFDGELDQSHYDAPDVGIVNIHLCLKMGKFDQFLFSDLRKSLLGHTVHEFQHVVQRLFFGSNYQNNDTLEYHVDDIDEIDARVEEIIAMEDDQQKIINDRDFFVKQLTAYALQYLQRNGITLQLPEHEKLLQRILVSHVEIFNEKFEKKEKK